jgi:hypothetical protein
MDYITEGFAIDHKGRLVMLCLVYRGQSNSTKDRNSVPIPIIGFQDAHTTISAQNAAYPIK